MRYWVLILMAITFSCCSVPLPYSIKPTRTIKNNVVEPPFVFSNCAHSHDCCSTGCFCCTQLSRDQKYDTIKTVVLAGVTRYVVTELLDYASSHEKSGIYYLFKDHETGKTRKYYSIIHQSKYPNQHNGFQTGIHYDGFKDGKEIVFDEHHNYHYLDSLGKTLPIKYHTKVYISEELTLVSTLIHGWRIYDFIDTNDRLIKGYFRFRLVDGFNHKKHGIGHMLNGEKVVLNSSGEIIIDGGFTDAKDIKNGYYAMRDKAGWWLFNSEGKKLSKRGFDHMGNMSDGMLSVFKNMKYGYLNDKGKLIIRLQFQRAMPFSDNRAAITYDNNVWGFIDKMGKLVIPFNFNNTHGFNDGLAPVGIGKNSNTDKWGVIDTEGNFVIKPEYDDLYAFKEGYAMAKINGKGSGIIDLNGRIIIPCEFRIDGYAWHHPWFLDSVIVVHKHGKKRKVMIYNSKGEIVADLHKYVYGKFIPMTNTLEYIPSIHVQKENGDIGLVNTEGEELIPAKWEHMYVLDRSYALVNNGNEYYLYNYLEGTRKALPKGRLQVVPSRGVFNFITEDNSQVIYYNYEGRILESY